MEGQRPDISCARAPLPHSSEAALMTSIIHVNSVAHCSRSQDIDLFKSQLSYCYNPLQDTCPITSAVLGDLIRTHVPWFFSIGTRSPIGCLKNVQHCTYGRDVVGYCHLRLIRCRHPAPVQDLIPLQRLHVFAHSRDPHPWIHIVYRHKNVWEYQWSNFIYNCMSTFLHYVRCKDALLDCSAPGGEMCESLTWVDEIPYLFFRTSPDIIGYSRCPDFSGHVRRPTQLPKLTPDCSLRPFP